MLDLEQSVWVLLLLMSLSPLTSITPLYPGKTIVKVGLFDTIPKSAIEMYCKDREPWGARFDAKFGVVEFEGMLPG